MSRSADASGEAQLARKYEDSRDLAGFETEGEPVEFAARLPSRFGSLIKRLLFCVRKLTKLV
jgi:hypothetical protein